MDIDTFYYALKITGLGMSGIFLFMLLFWGIIVLLHKLFPAKPEAPEKEG